MSFQLSSFLSGLAYLAFCLLIASLRAASFRAQGKCPRDGKIQWLDYKAPGNGRSAGEGDGVSSASPQSPFLWDSCLISLSLFLFLPCGTLSSLLPAPFGAWIVVVGLTVALGSLGGWECGWEWIRRQWVVPLCLGVSLAVIARYARERGVPGDLYALDAYVAMPLGGVTEGTGRLGLCILAAVFLLVLWQALPARRSPASEEKPPADDEAFLIALAAELWMLAAGAFWVCLFFPLSFAFTEVPGITALGGLVLNALFFWAKLLAVEWLGGKLREKYPRGAALHAPLLLALLGLGAWLLLDAAAG
jgi:hypothetical protein